MYAYIYAQVSTITVRFGDTEVRLRICSDRYKTSLKRQKIKKTNNKSTREQMNAKGITSPDDRVILWAAMVGAVLGGSQA